MKKNIVLILVLISIYSKAEDSLTIKKMDCDGCGCSVSASNLAFESLFSKRFVGVKYLHQHYKIKENLFVNHPDENQYFNTTQFWFRIPIYKKLEVHASLPYQNHHQKNQNISGIGDANLLLTYNLLNKENSTNQLHIGLGTKFPTGKFDNKSTSTVNPSFQVGTGSYDAQILINYIFRKDRVLFLATTDYVVKGTNKYYYKFGNQWNSSIIGYYIFKNSGSFLFSGKMGVQSEVFASNVELNEKVPKTLGNILLGKTGVEFSIKNWIIGCDVSLPITNNLASRNIQAVSRSSLFLNYSF